MAGHIIRHTHKVTQLYGCNTKYFPLIFSRVAHKYAQVDLESSRFKSIYRDLHGAIEDNVTAKDFVYALNKRERDLLHVELQKFNIDMKDVPGAGTHSKLTRAQRKAVALHNALPFIGFGFLDNFLMIIAGEYIEFRFGAMLGISTMAAAALGNWISDLAGVQTAHYVEVLTSKLGVKAPALSPEQVDMSSTRWAANAGKAIGVSIGCILGMLPLLFYTSPKKKKEEDEEDETTT
ncbi:transmembrane protein 65-like [Mya arenaria]|uniref:transmembrane protein 65-like n=1 Tax=Mya arenaria TaxID=6604 RepID=UPI0022E8DC4F|nr:transmembrane protein 65-like [Mya arenaria]